MTGDFEDCFITEQLRASDSEDFLRDSLAKNSYYSFHFYIYFLYMYGCFVCVHVCVSKACLVLRRQTRLLEFFEWSYTLL